ncbi:MAG: transaminase [Trebouxia sp. A1-2]|nr:MAG: transaminase [Trebouxia sp. A1-2]
MATVNGHSSTPDVKPLNDLFTSLPTTIFTVMTNLAIKHKTINLGQGFPDEEGPDKMKQLVGAATIDQHNQYPPMFGIPELRQAVARHSKAYGGIDVQWDTETLVTVGATEAIAASFLGILNEGDEVIMFDPMYDCYGSMAQRAGGIIKPVKLKVEDWSVDRTHLQDAFSAKTKLVIVNTPHNPTGKVFSKEDLQFIADLCIQYNTYVLLDEVYEHLVFEGSQHVSLRSLPGMQERSIRIGSAGKTFSFTAWKIGWVTGPCSLINAIAKAHQFLVFTVPSNLQRAVAYGLDNESSFFTTLGHSLEQKRTYLAQRLKKIGFNVLPAQGSYFLMADFRWAGRRCCLRGAMRMMWASATGSQWRAGVTALPVSAFYVSPDPPRYLVRFCFCKADEKLHKACNLLENYFAR